jgi:hypothetical protein
MHSERMAPIEVFKERKKGKKGGRQRGREKGEKERRKGRVEEGRRKEKNKNTGTTE